MVIGLKDNICYKDHKVSASSKILEGFTSVYSSTVVERLIAEDAIIIGRLNCDEFAMGASNENSAYGAVLNDADNERVAGGSSTSTPSPSRPARTSGAIDGWYQDHKLPRQGSQGQPGVAAEHGCADRAELQAVLG
jgi:hypothetical protein